jgi:hypothetical protein
MRLIPVRLVAAALLAASVSCSSSTNVSGGTNAAFAGTWAQREVVAGTSFVFTLAVDGTNVTGTGTYSVEGGNSGTLTETGAISGDTLQLAITYDNGALAQFEGQIASASVLSGSLHFGPPQSLTPAAVVTFDRKG